MFKKLISNDTKNCCSGEQCGSWASCFYKINLKNHILTNYSCMQKNCLVSKKELFIFFHGYNYTCHEKMQFWSTRLIWFIHLKFLHTFKLKRFVESLKCIKLISQNFLERSFTYGNICIIQHLDKS